MAYQNRYPVVAPHAGPSAASGEVPPPQVETSADAASLDATQPDSASYVATPFVTTPYASSPLMAAPVVAVPMATAFVNAPVAADPYVARRGIRGPTTMRPTRDEMSRRITVFAFGIVQGLIIVRIVLLALDARAANGLVAAILNLSQILVAPFDGILHTNALHSGGSALDVAAVVALIGWTLVEGLVFASISLFRREPA
jgi:hypothetical protein